MQLHLTDTPPQRFIFDGFEPQDWHEEIAILPLFPFLRFTWAELAGQPFAHLKGLVSAPYFQQIIENQHIAVPQNQWQTYCGMGGLPIYYLQKYDERHNTSLLVLISFGEYQPSRYIAHLEGVYQVIG
jgi:hypothetical protein